MGLVEDMILWLGKHYLLARQRSSCLFFSLILGRTDSINQRMMARKGIIRRCQNICKDNDLWNHLSRQGIDAVHKFYFILHIFLTKNG